jgi:hypothetical protein
MTAPCWVIIARCFCSSALLDSDLALSVAGMYSSMYAAADTATARPCGIFVVADHHWEEMAGR